MKQKYWFSRSVSQPKYKQKISADKYKNTFRQIKSSKNPQNSLNQLEVSTSNLRTILNELQQYRKQNKLIHNELTKEGTIKEVKCLRHNSAIILFCKNDSKLLCSSCAFGTTHHNKHKMQEARLMSANVDENLMNSEKILKLKKIEISEEKNQWQKTWKSIENIRYSTLERLDKEHNQKMKSLSKIYLQNKSQIESTFDLSYQQLKNLTTTLEETNRSFTFKHSVAWVQQLYYQEVMDKLPKISKLIPSSKLGERFVITMKQASKFIISTFKQAYRNMSE